MDNFRKNAHALYSPESPRQGSCSLFSTDDGDACLLDADDNRAPCLLLPREAFRLSRLYRHLMNEGIWGRGNSVSVIGCTCFQRTFLVRHRVPDRSWLERGPLPGYTPEHGNAQFDPVRKRIVGCGLLLYP